MKFLVVLGLILLLVGCTNTVAKPVEGVVIAKSVSESYQAILKEMYIYPTSLRVYYVTVKIDDRTYNCWSDGITWEELAVGEVYWFKLIDDRVQIMEAVK